MIELLNELEKIRNTVPLCRTCSKTITRMYYGSTLYCSYSTCPIHFAIEAIRRRIAHARVPKLLQTKNQFNRYSTRVLQRAAANTTILPEELATSFKVHRFIDIAANMLMGVTTQDTIQNRRPGPNRRPPLRRTIPCSTMLPDTTTSRRHSRMT